MAVTATRSIVTRTFTCDGRPGGSKCDATAEAVENAWPEGWVQVWVKLGHGDLERVKWEKESHMGVGPIWYSDYVTTTLCDVCGPLFADFVPVHEERKRRWLGRKS